MDIPSSLISSVIHQAEKSLEFKAALTSKLGSRKRQPSLPYLEGGTRTTFLIN